MGLMINFALDISNKFAILRHIAIYWIFFQIYLVSLNQMSLWSIARVITSSQAQAGKNSQIHFWEAALHLLKRNMYTNFTTLWNLLKTWSISLTALISETLIQILILAQKLWNSDITSHCALNFISRQLIKENWELLFVFFPDEELVCSLHII